MRSVHRGLTVVLAGLLVLPLSAAAHPLLEAIPRELLQDPYHKSNLCQHANRLVVATVQDATPSVSTPEQRAQAYPPIYTDVKLGVELQIDVGTPMVDAFGLRVGGGEVGGVRVILPHMPGFEVGTRWALALRYPPDGWDGAEPLILERLELEPTAPLPPIEDLQAAYLEYCR